MTGDFGICTAATSGKILHCGAVSVGITYMADYKWVYLNHSHKDAIEKMMLAINALNAFSRELSETTAEEFKKVPRITITELKGGIAPNIKSPTASFTVDRRLIPGETVDEVHHQIMGVLDELKTSDSEMEYVYEVFGEYSCLDVDENEEIVASAARAYKQVMGKDIEKAWRIGGVRCFRYCSVYRNADAKLFLWN